MKSSRLAMLLVFFVACSSHEEKKAWEAWMPGVTKVLIIGDSISLGYTPHVRERLNAFQVQHGGGDGSNNSSSRETRSQVDSWLVGLGQGDSITWNNGLHEAMRDALPAVETHISLTEYRENLHAIAQKLVATQARIFFFTTTYVPAHISWQPAIQKRDDLNRVAREVMTDYPEITVVDLGAFSETIKPLMINADLGDDLHYTSAGYDAIADFIVNSLWPPKPS